MSKRFVRVTFLTLLMLIGCCFAACEIWIFVRNAQTAPTGQTPPAAKLNDKFRIDNASATSPMEFLRRPKKTTGLFREISSAPPVESPKGAKQIRAVGREAIRDGYVELQWSYEISDDKEAVIAHYSKALKTKGFVLRQEKRKAQHVGMVFHRYPAVVTLSLQPVAKKGNLLNVTICENRPERSGDFLKSP